MVKISAWMAIAFGLALSVLEALRNWGDWQWWPFWTVDYLAALLLVIGGFAALNGRGAAWLAAGWGFACAMFWMSFFSHYEGVLQAAEVSAREQRLTMIIGGLFALTAAGLVLSLAGRKSV